MSGYLDILNSKAKEWDCPGLIDRDKVGPIKRIPFSSPWLNYCTYGGIPRNRITMFYGRPNGGKSTTAIDLCNNAKKLFEQEYQDQVMELKDRAGKGDKNASLELDELEDRGVKRVAYVDVEHTFDDAWAMKMGINKGDIDIVQPPDVSGEQILQLIQDIVCSNQIGLVVIDSLPSIVPEAQLKKKFGERTVAARAGLFTDFCTKMVPKLDRYDCTLLMLNQMRENMDNPYVDKIPGGEAIQFYSSLIIRFVIGNPVDILGNDLPMNTEEPAGYKISARITKQKTAPWNRKNGSYYLMTEDGIRVDMDYAQLAVNKYGIIRKSGAWYTMCDPYTGEILSDADGKPVKLNGMIKVYDYFQSNPEYYENLKSYILSDIDDNYVGGSENATDD